MSSIKNKNLITQHLLRAVLPDVIAPQPTVEARDFMNSVHDIWLLQKEIHKIQKGILGINKWQTK